jgi:plasmid stability protein
MVAMASITLKALSPSLHRALKFRAARHKRSLNQEVIAVLEEGVASVRRVRVEEMIAEARDFRASLKLRALPEKIAAYKRQGRA